MDIRRNITTLQQLDDVPSLADADDGKVLAWDFGTQAFVAAELSADEGIDLSDFSNGQMPYVLDSAFAPSGLTWESSRMTVNGDIELTGQEITDANYQKYLSAIRINGEPLYRAITAVWDGSAWDADAGSIGLGFYALRKNTGKQCTSLGFNSLYNNSGDNVVGAGAYAGSGNTGYRTSGLGGYAIYQNDGNYCNGFGYYALYKNKGHYNCGFGNFTLNGCESNNVTAFGHGAGYGLGAGYNNTTLLGYGAMPTEENQVVLGNTAVDTVLTYGCYISDQSANSNASYTAFEITGNDIYTANSIQMGAIGGGPAIWFSESSLLYFKAISAHSLVFCARVNSGSHVDFQASDSIRILNSSSDEKFRFDFSDNELQLLDETSLGNDMSVGTIKASMPINTEASYTGRAAISVTDYSAERELISGDADGSNISAFFVDKKIMMTPEGGIAVKLTNKTGAATEKGAIVTTSDSYDDSFDLTDSDGYDCIGAVYDDGVADGSDCYVVYSGIAEVLLKDATDSTTGDWIGISDTAGRAEASAIPSPPTSAEHFREIGHVLESKTSGTDVLTKIMMHFN